MRRLFSCSCLLLVVGCGGKSTDQTAAPESPWGAAGAGDGAGGESGGRSESPAGEAGASRGGADSPRPVDTESAGAGGDSPIDPEPLIGSGSRYCVDERYCFGLSCYAPEGWFDRVCVSECTTSDDCGRNEACLESPDLRATCYRRCEYPSDCESGFDCFDFTGQHEELVCFPTPWADYWLRRSE